jgi:hypothetical protein
VAKLPRQTVHGQRRTSCEFAPLAIGGLGRYDGWRAFLLD